MGLRVHVAMGWGRMKTGRLDGRPALLDRSRWFYRSLYILLIVENINGVPCPRPLI